MYPLILRTGKICVLTSSRWHSRHTWAVSDSGFFCVGSQPVFPRPVSNLLEIITKKLPRDRMLQAYMFASSMAGWPQLAGGSLQQPPSDADAAKRRDVTCVLGCLLILLICFRVVYLFERRDAAQTGFQMVSPRLWRYCNFQCNGSPLQCKSK